MADYPPKRAAAYEIQFPMFSATTGSLLTGLTVTTTVSKDGGTYASTTNSAAEVATASGDYKLTLTGTEMTADRVGVHATATGARDVYVCVETATRQLIDLAFPNTSGRGMDVTAGGDVDAVVQSVAAGAITAASLNADIDTYQATVKLTDDNGGTTDRYTVVWYQNSVPLTSGITSPTIQVWKAADGVDLVASTAMTQIASTGTYRYNEATNRIVDGVAYIAKVTASIDSATRSWEVGVSRDS